MSADFVVDLRGNPRPDIAMRGVYLYFDVMVEEQLIAYSRRIFPSGAGARRHRHRRHESDVGVPEAERCAPAPREQLRALPCEAVIVPPYGIDAQVPQKRQPFRRRKPG